MARIIFKGWRVGMRGIPFVLLLREKAALSLKNSKEIKERVVNNEIIEITIPDESVAVEIVNEASKLGVICEVN